MKTTIEKALYSYLADCLTDRRAMQGVEFMLNRELEDEEIAEVFRLIYKLFHKYYKLSK